MTGTGVARRWSSLVITGTLALFLLPIALGRSFWVRDAMRFHYPLKLFLRQRMLDGELALWNPRLGFGRPLLGMVQPAVLYPLDVILLLPAPHGIDLFFALHLLIGAFGMRRWLRTLDSDELASTVGALLFALSGYLVSQAAGNGAYVVSAAWVPWILASLNGDTFLRQLPRAAIFFALALLGGDPQAVWFALLVGAVQCAVGARRSFAILAGGAAVGALIALPQLIAGAEVAAVGRPGGVTLADASHFALHPARLVELVWPGAFGEPYSQHWFVHALVDEGTGLRYEPWSAGIYLGLFAPLLCAFALVGRRPLDLMLLGVALFGLVAALGLHAPLFAIVHRFAPGARLFRYPEKFFFLTTLAGAALAARGFSRLPRRAPWIAGGLAVALALASLFAGPSLAQVLVGRLGRVTPEEAGAVLTARARIAVAIAVMGALAMIRGRAWLALVLVGDLFVASLPLLSFAPAAIYSTRSPVLDDLPPSDGPSRFYRPQLFVLGDDSALATRMTLTPNCGLEDGIAHLDAYDNFQTPAERAFFAELRPHPLRLLQIAGARHALVDEAQLRAVPPGLTVLKRYPAIAAALVEVAEVAPRVYLAEDARPVADLEAAAHALAAPGFLPGRSAVVENGEARRSSGACRLLRYAPERIEFVCDAAKSAYAIVGDAHFPGWRARVDGTSVEILRANALMRAIPIGAGQHRVELEYAPRGLAVSLAIAAVTLLLCLAAWARAMMRR